MRSTFSALRLSIPLAAFCAIPLASQTPQVGQWTFDEGAGTTAGDLGPNGLTGTLTNFGPSPWTTGVFGSALSFDGVDDYVELPVGQGLPIYRGRGEPYSVAFWVKAPAQNDRRCYSEGNSPSGAVGNSALFTIGSGRSSNLTTDKVQVYIRNDDSVFIELYSNTVVFDDTWHHVAWVDNAGDGRLYVDGVLDASLDFDYSNALVGPLSPGYGSFTTNRVAIGAVLRETVAAPMTGELDDFHISSTAISQADIDLLLLAPVPPLVCSASVGKFGFGCGGGPLDITATGALTFGGALSLQVTGGAPGFPAFLCLGGAPEPIDLSALGFAGCNLYSANSTCFAVGTLDGVGESPAISIPIPPTSTLLCAVVAFQGLSIVGGGLEVSPAIVATVGL